MPSSVLHLSSPLQVPVLVIFIGGLPKMKFLDGVDTTDYSCTRLINRNPYIICGVVSREMWTKKLDSTHLDDLSRP